MMRFSLFSLSEPTQIVRFGGVRTIIFEGVGLIARTVILSSTPLKALLHMGLRAVFLVLFQIMRLKTGVKVDPLENGGVECAQGKPSGRRLLWLLRKSN